MNISTGTQGAPAANDSAAHVTQIRQPIAWSSLGMVLLLSLIHI